MKRSLRSRLVLGLSVSIAAVTAAFCLVYLAREATKIRTITTIGDIWSFVRLEPGQSFGPFVEVDTDDFPHPPYPQQTDLLVAIEGRPATAENYFSFFTTETPPGAEYEIMFMHDGVLNTTDVVTRSIPGPLKLQIWIVFILRTLIVIGLLFTGLLALSRRWLSPSVRTLTMFCTVLAVEMVLARDMIADYYAAFMIPAWIIIGFTIASLASAGFWVKLHLQFPRLNSFYRRHGMLLNSLVFLPVPVFGFFWLATGIFQQFPVVPIIIYRTVFLATGFVLLFRNFRESGSFIEKRQIRLVLWGSAPGITVYILYTWFTFLFAETVAQMSVQLNMLVTNVIFLLLLLIPLSFLYAFRKYSLLSIEGKLKRGTRFVVVNLLLVMVFFGVLYLFGKVVIEGMGISSQAPILALGIILALIFMPTQRKLRERVENYFYPERKRFRILLRDFLASGAARTGETTFWSGLVDKLENGLSVQCVYPVLRRDDGSGSFVAGSSEPAPFLTGDRILSQLMEADSPVLLDEAMEGGSISLSAAQKEWLMERKCALLLPLVTKEELVGFLAVSCKANGEDFSSEELELLGSFSAHIALAAENLKLMKERLEKQKLQEQISVARSVQEGLLPKDIPSIPGLEVSALIRFCMDVAGDYYDIITFEDGSAVFAIGDVAGKGIGPALLMANLQASLRTAAEMGVPLREAAEKINTLVYENTPPELFITFFFASVNPTSGTIEYVNAGHNPPLLLGGGGRREELSEGGLLLGVVPSASYRQGVAEFRPGDTLLMYTDGVSEAMNGLEEEFGENRIAGLAMENSDMKLSGMLRKIEEEVMSFQQSPDFRDDFTLLAVRQSPSGAVGLQHSIV